MAKNSKTHRSRFALGIVLAVIILVVVGGAAYLLLRSHSKTLAQVNGVTITQADINKQLDFPLSQTPGIFDTNGGAANQKDVDQRNLNAAIDQQLLLQEAKKRGIKAASQVVNAAYSALAKSYSSDSALQDKLKQANMTESQLKSAVADNLTIYALAKSLVPDSSATDAKLKAYYDSHKDRWLSNAAKGDIIFITNSSFNIASHTLVVTESSSPGGTKVAAHNSNRLDYKISNFAVNYFKLVKISGN